MAVVLQKRGYTRKALTHVGRYEIVGELGRGAMGVVYKALDPTIGRTVALKAIRLSEFHDAEERERVHQRLWREARSAGMLSHPNIVTIHDVVEQDSGAFIVMEFVDGQSLGHLLRRGELPERDDLLRYLRQVAGALDYAHQKGVIHRDVKPGNIIIAEPDVDSRRIAKVADFGVAKFISQETTHSGTMIGTPSYISPEQIEGLTSDGRSDQFSLAVVIYELLTGQKPFDSDNLSGLFYQICRHNPKAAELINPQLPNAVGRVLMRGLAKEPSKRYGSCTELVTELATALHPQPAPEIPAVLEHVVVPLRPRLPSLDDDDSDVDRPRRVVPKAAVAIGIATVLLGSAVALQRFKSHGPEKWTEVAKSSGPAVEVPQPARTQVKVPAATRNSGSTAAAGDPTMAGSASSVGKAGSGRTAVLLPVQLSSEPQGARVQVDDREETTCVTPCTLELPSGRHTLQATNPGFNLAQRIFNLPAESELTIALQRSMGVLMLASEPSGSTVVVDGKESGDTPVTLHLPAGPHRVVLSRGEQTHEETVTVKADEVESRRLQWR